MDIINVINRAALVHEKSHTNINGSVATDLIVYVTHDYSLFTDNNWQVYFDLEKTLRGTIYIFFLNHTRKLKIKKNVFNTVITQYTDINK